MMEAWWDQTVLEIAMRTHETADDVWFPFGDSMVQVNKYGVRVMDEKQTYNDRGPVHFSWDAGRREYPNLLLFQIYDDNVAQNPATGPFRGLVPPPGMKVDYVLSADTLEGLAEAIDARLAEIVDRTGDVRLAPSFAATLKDTIARFNDFAREGVDRDFGRGEKPIQIAWQGEPRPGLRNPCLAPFSDTGPYHCMILAAGALDTKGGPQIDAQARVLGLDGFPIPGLYGAGNCVSSPAGAGYWGGGGTIGPALTFGVLAGRNAARERKAFVS
jgi:3-oxosteroid 1-dehydrogenase